MGVGVPMEAYIVCQSEKMLILSGKMRFLGYIVFDQDIRIEEKQIKAVRDWPEPQSVRDIQVFLGFANFY